MRMLNACPACQSADLVPAPLRTNVTGDEVARFGEGVVSDSRFAICRQCDLLFARQRQDNSDAEAYYRAFQVLEKRDYATYPPPEMFVDVQHRFSDWLLGRLSATGVLNGGGSVLNVRCELGVHLARLRDKWGFGEIYGLDHFESNLHYARDHLRLKDVALFHPAKMEIPFTQSKFDLILANHQITHALQPLELLQQFREWLTPKGALVLYNENDHLRLLRRKRIYKEGVGNYHKQLLTPHSLQNLCRRAGIEWEYSTHRDEAIKWAAPRDCMLVVARRSEPVPPRALPKMLGSPTRRAMTLGRSVYGMYQLSKGVERMLGRRAA